MTSDFIKHLIKRELEKRGCNVIRIDCRSCNFLFDSPCGKRFLVEFFRKIPMSHFLRKLRDEFENMGYEVKNC